MATVLLGVLLVVVLQFTRRVPTKPVTTNFVVERTGLHIDGYSDLVAFLESRGVDAHAAIADSIDWRQAHGFFHGDRFFSADEGGASTRTYESFEYSRLESMSQNGDLAATQALAAQMLLEDPFASLALYTRAANHGSIFAMLQIGGLRETFSNLALDRFSADPAYLQKLSELRGENSQNKLKVEAFAYVAAAIRDGGIVIVDQDLLDWAQRLSAELPPGKLASACALSENYFLKIGAARRSHGITPFTTEAPPIFFGIPNLQEQLPCRSTGHSIIWLLDLSRCSVTPVNQADQRTLDLYICQS